jgi:hypothetical protein
MVFQGFKCWSCIKETEKLILRTDKRYLQANGCLRWRFALTVLFYAKIRTCYFFLYNKNDTYRFLEKLSGVTRWPD